MIQLKQNAKITFCAVTSALAAVFMLLSYFPYFTYAAPAVAGLLMIMIVIEVNVKWAFTAYAVSSVLVFLFAEPESRLMYICLFGYYPILKALIERINRVSVEWILKLAVFNAAVLLIYGVFSFIFDISVDDFSALGKYGAYIFLAVGNVAFVFYDIAISRMSMLYMARLHDKVKKIFRI